MSDAGRGIEVTIGSRGPQLVLSSPDAAAAVAEVLETFNAARAHRGLLPMLELVDVAAACRHLHALVQLVPQSEPVGDDQPSPPARWLSTACVARRLGISARAVTKRIAAGALPARKVGGRWLIDVKEFAHAA